MKTFEEFQTLAMQVPLSLRNNLDRINLPALGLQEEAGKIGSFLVQASASGRFSLGPEQKGQLQHRLSDMLWYLTLLCEETGMTLQDVAQHSLTQILARANNLDPDQR